MTVRLLILLALGIAFAAPAIAQYPSRAIKLLPHGAAGTGPDVIARLLAATMSATAI